MSQRLYVLNLLKRFGMQNCKPATTPLAPNLKLTKPLTVSKEEMLTFPYQTLIGSLMYLAVATRPDIAYTDSSLSQFNTNYAEEHWKAVKRILRYLKGTSNFGLVYRRSGKPLRVYADADWGACPIDRRSYTGFLLKYGDAAVSWEARKQRTVEPSSTEAEYMSLTEAVKETLWLRTFLREIDELLVDAIDVYNDNFGAQELARNSVFHASTKHIDIRYHFIRETLSRGFVNVI
uniref:Reverse transcriptase Ty1/copia-type domain-containing protein n=1 Tax=Trichuris muris TaxID=70415 RepID=A0A5S6QB82_TRIMR